MSYFNENYAFVSNLHIQQVFVGLSADLEFLRTTFLAQGDMSFESFALLWRELKFASIFGLLKNATLIMEYTQGVLHFAKGYVFAAELSSAVFGLYLVYSIFFKQSFIGNKSSKLRLTLSEFIDMKAVLVKLHNASYHQAVQVFFELLDQGGVHCVAEPIETGMESGFRKYFNKSDDDGIAPLKPREAKLPFDTSLFQLFQDELQAYTNNKPQAFKNSEAFSTTSDFSAKMMTMLSHFGETEVPSDTDDKSVVKEPIIPTDIGIRRRMAKDKSYKTGDAIAPTCEKAEEKESRKLYRGIFVDRAAAASGSSATSTWAETEHRSHNSDPLSLDPSLLS